jgi:biotin operon repressor
LSLVAQLLGKNLLPLPKILATYAALRFALLVASDRFTCGQSIARRQMHKRKSKKKPARTAVAARRQIGSASTPVAPADPKAFVSGPKLRKLLDVSPVTLWRWRHDKTSGFPAAKVIKGRLYFPWGAVSDWIARQPEAA